MRLKLFAPNEESPPRRAAVYMRMSTERQVYSLGHQAQYLGEFAQRNELAITQTYADAGKSGLHLKGRPALISLLEDINRGPDFEVLLIYDVSRWGRFQDVDESAFYEYQCRRAGVQVMYCAELFENDGSAFGSIVKSIKRTMAAEYSRELSVKISLAQHRLSRLGYWQGAPAGFGLHRAVITPEGVSKGKLGPGQTKFLREDRVRLVAGDPEEVATVRKIFDLYCEGLNRSQIARRLNAEAGPMPPVGKWGVSSLRQILRNPKYVGACVYGRLTSPLGAVPRPTPRETWAWADDVFEPLISKAQFALAGRIELARSGQMTNEQMLDRLRALLAKHGELTARIIDADLETPHQVTFRARFGDLVTAYGLIGWAPAKDYSRLIASNRRRSGLWSAHMIRKHRAQALGLPPPVYVSQSPRTLERAARTDAKARLLRADRDILLNRRPPIPHPGRLIRDHLAPAFGLTEESLATALSMPIAQLKPVLDEVDPIDRTLSNKLTHLFHTPRGIFLRVQAAHDAARADSPQQ